MRGMIGWIIVFLLILAVLVMFSVKAADTPEGFRKPAHTEYAQQLSTDR